MADGMRIDRSIIRRVDQSTLALYGQQNAIISRSLFLASGNSAHTNKAFLYDGGHKVVFIDCVWWAVGGLPHHARGFRHASYQMLDPRRAVGD